MRWGYKDSINRETKLRDKTQSFELHPSIADWVRHNEKSRWLGMKSPRHSVSELILA
jgi:hypothetical protein